MEELATRQKVELGLVPFEDNLRWSASSEEESERAGYFAIGAHVGTSIDTKVVVQNLPNEAGCG